MITYIHVRRLLMGGFAACLALLLGTWSWASLASSASLSVTPATPRQNDTVTLAGQGFLPGEKIAVWITYPDFRVYGVAELTATDDGSFSYPYLPDFLGATFTPTGKYTYTAHGKQSEREVYADITVSIAPAAGASAGVILSAEQSRNVQGAYVTLCGSGYQSNEQVALWVRYPDNAVADLGRTSADTSGQVEYVFPVTGLPVGHYALTARGLTSAANGIVEFDLAVDDLTVATGQATLQIGPSPESQRSYASFLGVGFGPNEIVTIWVTLPNYATRWIGDVRTDSNGAFRAVLYLSEQEPVGTRSYTAYGNTSGLRAVTTYTLQAGGTRARSSIGH